MFLKGAGQHNPCPCGKSSDAFNYTDDGAGKCQSCDKFFKSHEIDPETIPLEVRGLIQHSTKTDTVDVTLEYVPYRGITETTQKVFGVKTEVDKDGPRNLVFNLPSGRVFVKSVREKKFGFRDSEITNPDTPLFGQDLFPAGSARSITITEGYCDAMAVYQMMGKYPVVGVQSCSSAKAEVSKAYEYINSFERIYLCFDADEQGRAATKAVANLFDFNKVYVVSMLGKDKGLKDAHDYLEGGQEVDFKKTWWAAQRFLPEGVISGFSAFDDIIADDYAKPSVDYPFEKLQQMTYGIRTGELVLFTAMEGIGKTTIFRHLEHHLLTETDTNIGVIHLEENKARTLKGLVGYELEKPIHLPDTTIPNSEITDTLRKVVGRDDRLHIYSHFGSSDPDDIIAVVRFLAGACECKHIFLDHITMVVTGLAGEDERRALDHISTKLAMMVEELDFSLFLISHVNDDGQTRGSRNIGKVADMRIDLHRNFMAQTLDERLTTKMVVSKNRFAGRTGPAGRLMFNTDTHCLEEQEELLE